MSKPQRFEQVRVAIRNIPYQQHDEKSARQALTGGVLGKGKVVWVESSFERKNKAVPAYLEDVGVVSVEDRYLGPMD